MVELLVTLAITVSVLSVMTVIMVGGMATTKRVREQSDQYESLRLAAFMFTEDARLAFSNPTCSPGAWARLYKAQDQSQLVEYLLTPQSDGSYDLHRREWTGVPTSGVSKGNPYAGGNMVSDFIVAQRINEPTQQFGDVFGCATNFGTVYPRGEVVLNLEKPLLHGQATSPAIQVFAFPRSQ